MPKRICLFLLLFCFFTVSGCSFFKESSSSSFSESEEEPSMLAFEELEESFLDLSQKAQDDSSRESFSRSDVSRDKESGEAFPSSESLQTSSGSACLNGRIQLTDGLSFCEGILIVNKRCPLPETYAPGPDPQAAQNVAALIAQMQQQGFQVSSATSGYRSYEYQRELYQSYVSQYGQQAADSFSARPGYSEHQSGLAFDLLDSSGQLLTRSEETQWLLENSWKYGFIVRYQPGMEEKTGYLPEPWHLRYLGERAFEIARSGLSLEEYLGIEGGDYC